MAIRGPIFLVLVLLLLVVVVVVRVLEESLESLLELNSRANSFDANIAQVTAEVTRSRTVCIKRVHVTYP